MSQRECREAGGNKLKQSPALQPVQPEMSNTLQQNKGCY